MRWSLPPRGRAGASTYLEVFILIGIAVGGSAAVLGAVLPYASAVQGPGVTIEDVAIRQGTYLALERLTVVNSGQSPMPSFVISTSPASPSAPYCYTLYNPATGDQLGGTCPVMAMGPGSVPVTYSVPFGQALGIVITIMGAAFRVGSQYAVTVTTSAGAQQTVGLQVAPA
jgi:hypothetical protein